MSSIAKGEGSSSSLEPLVVLIGGPNGAGKSTTAPELLVGALAVHEFVNADAIAAGLSAFRPDGAAIAAGRVMLGRMRDLALMRASFAFETTLASRMFAPWLLTLREQGYRTHLAFLALPSAELAVARVAGRVRVGGHAVAEHTIRRRYRAGLHNLRHVYPPVLDSWQVYDNARAGGPRLVAHCRGRSSPVILDAPTWANLMERSGA